MSERNSDNNEKNIGWINNRKIWNFKKLNLEIENWENY